MLKRVGGEISEEGAVISIKEASFPVPFKAGLEFNSPVHGNWNIVHTGMLMPEARQIYVCADNCMRGVVLTAAEMNAADRFSFVILEEENLLNGNLEDITIEGVSDVLNRLPQKPKAVLLFTVCLHHFLGCDLEMVYHELENRFPDICFVRCYMDPIMQKHGLTPDQKLRKAMYDPLKPDKKDPHTVTITGSDFTLDETSDLKRLLRAYDYKVPEMPECHTWEEYQRLGEGSLFVTVYPPGKYGGEMLAERLKRKHLYLPGSWNYEEIRGELQKLAETLNLLGNTGTEDKTGSENRIVSDTENKWTGVGDFSVEEEIRKCEEALQNARVLIGDTPIALDYLFHPRPLKFCLGYFVFVVCKTAFGHHGFCSLFRILGSLCVNIFFPLPCSCKKTTCSVHYRKHSANTGCCPSGSVFHHHTGFSHAKGSTEIAVSCKDGKISTDTSANYTLNISFIKQSVRCSDS